MKHKEERIKMKHKNDLFFITKLNGKEKFSFRKISVGLVTVALGTTFFLESGQTVQAADQSNNDSQQNTTINQNSANPDNSRTLTIQKSETTNTANNTTGSSNNETNSSYENNSKQNTTNNLKNDKPTLQQEATAPVQITGSSTNTSLIADVTQGSFSVHVANDSSHPIIINHNQQVNVSVADSDNLLKFDVNATKIGNFDVGVNNNSGTKNFTFTYTGSDNGVLSGFDATFPFVAVNSASQVYHEQNGAYPDFNLPITVTLPNDQSYTQTLPIKINPYEDKVVKDEILHGFIMGPKVIWTPGQDGNPGTDGIYTENGANYTGPEPSAAADIPADQQQDARLMQYGIDWNYGSVANGNSPLNPLSDVLAHIKFSDHQKILPSTIKVFKIPNDVKIIDADGHRTNINNYYNKVVNYQPSLEDTNFEDFLRKSISDNNHQIVIDQKGSFTVNGQDYSKEGPYFIQLDTQLDTNYIPDWINNPNEGPSITTPIKNEWNLDGSGVTNSFVQTYTNFKFDPKVDLMVNIYFIDENTDQEIAHTSRDIIASPNSSITNPTPNIIKTLESQGYKVDEAATKGQNSIKHLVNFDPAKQNFINYDSNNINVSTNSLKYYVYLYHDTSSQSETQTTSVIENINYIYSNGTKKGQIAATPYTHKVTYIRQGTKDLVTNEINWSEWTPDSALDAVVSPKATDSTYSLVAPQNIPAIKLNISSNGTITTQNDVPLNYTVKYYAPEKATLRFYDDTDHEYLDSYLIQHNQNSSLSDIYADPNDQSSEQAISFAGADKIVNFLNDEHYKFAGVSGLGSSTNTDYSKISYGNFDDDETKNQDFVLHFTHELNQVSEDKTISEQAILYAENGPKQGQTFNTLNLGNIKFTRTGQEDLVTNQTSWNKWTVENNGKVLSLPLVVSKVYKINPQNITQVAPASKKFEINNNQISPLSFEANNDQSLIDSLEDNSTYLVKVPYALSENITVTYIDDTTGAILETKELSGEPNTSANYSTKETIDKYIAKHYVLVSDQTNQQTLIFDNDEDPDDQNYEVHFAHELRALSNSKTIHETIIYVYENGQEAAPNYIASTNFSQTGNLDLVTNVESWEKWTPDYTVFKLVESPIIAGYTADHKQIDQQLVTHGSADLLFKVIYTTKPVQPTKPVEPTKPVQPTKPVEPIKPVQPTKPIQSASKGKLSHQNNVVVSIKEDKQNILPQTGTKKNGASLLGLAFSAASLLLGLIGNDLKRKKKN